VTGAALRPVALKFQLSDWTLASVWLPLQVAAVPLGAAEVAATPCLPTYELLKDSEGYLLRALPLGRAQPVLRPMGDFLCYVMQQYDRCYIDLAQSFDDYKAKFSSKTRSTITRKVKKWAEYCGGELTWRSYRTPDEMPQFHALARSVSVRTYQERLLDAGLPEGPDFVSGMRRAAELDRARGYILFHGDKPVSYLYCPIEDGIVVYAYLGYDPEYLKHSVGIVLQWLALEQLFDEARFRYFDFTEGESDHKRLFATHLVPAANVMFLRRTWRNRGLLWVHSGFNSAVAALARALSRWGVRTRLRQWLRFGRQRSA
jgi:Acetyltransferase (GNAT) domain